MDPAIDSLILENIRQLKVTIDIDESNLTPIQEFYKDAKIFITGCTGRPWRWLTVYGFIGQILIEKLLRSCPVSTLYLLVREKKNKSTDTRLDEIFEGHLFASLKKICPDFRKKIIVVEGDCQFPELGLSDENKKLLIEKVNIVFHVAATVRFDEKLDKATRVNVKATKELHLLVQQMLKLKSYVYVSTAYSNCPGKVVEEKIYPPAIQPHQLMQICESTTEIMLDKITPYLIGDYPNTYTYTKQIAEHVVGQESNNFASAIYRPTIVVSTYREPIRGWINNIYGPTGALFGCGLGLIRVINCDGECVANLIPVDMCVNGLIASALDAYEKFTEANESGKKFETMVYNYDSANDQPIIWGQMKELTKKYGLYIPPIRMIWVDVTYFIKSYTLYLIVRFLLHIVPAIIMDFGLFCRGKKTRMVTVYNKIHKFLSVIAYFSSQNFKFHTNNVQNMLKRMSPKDKEVFFCDLKQLDWNEFCTTYGCGTRLYLMNDPLETLPKARRYYKRLKIAHKILKASLWILSLTILWYILSTVFKIVFK